MVARDVVSRVVQAMTKHQWIDRGWMSGTSALSPSDADVVIDRVQMLQANVPLAVALVTVRHGSVSCTVCVVCTACVFATVSPARPASTRARFGWRKRGGA